MSTLRYFLSTYRLYRAHHSMSYALQSAYRIAFHKLPF